MKKKHPIHELRAAIQNSPERLDLLNDVVIYYNAVHYALVHDQFYSDKKKDEFEIAFQQLETSST